jgi:oxygen-dependent protoporphyrinogen oxidase
VAGFFTRRLGREAHDRLIAPFMAGVYAGNTANLSISAVMPRMVELERKFGSLTMGMLRSPKKTSRRTLRTASFADGMETLPQGLAQGLKITFNVKDTGIRQTAATVLTAPAYHAAGVVERRHPYLARLLERVEYAPILSVTTSVPDTSFPKPLRGFGFLVPRTEDLHILGTLFSSALFPGRAPHGSQLLTTFVGGAFEPEVINWPDNRVWEVVTSELQHVLKTSTKPEPVKLIRQRNAIPQYTIGHSRWVRSLREELKKIPGLFIAGNYIEGISVAACMEQGEKTAHAVADYLRRAK